MKAAYIGIDFLFGSQSAFLDHVALLLTNAYVWIPMFLALFLLPIFAVCAVLSSPILILTAIFLRNCKDPAWNNTVRFACSLIFFVLWPFHSVFYLILNYYQDLIEDIKR